MDSVKTMFSPIVSITSNLVDKLTPSIMKDIYEMLNDYKKKKVSTVSVKNSDESNYEIEYDDNMIPMKCYDVLKNTSMNTNLKARIFLVDLLFSLSNMKKCQLEVFGGFPRDIIYDCYNKGELEFNTDLDIRISHSNTSKLCSILSMLIPLGITFKKTNHYYDVLTVEFSIPMNEEVVIVPVDFVIVKYISTISNKVDFDVNNLIIKSKLSTNSYWTNNLYNAMNRCYNLDVNKKVIHSLIINEMKGLISFSNVFTSDNNYCLNHTFNAIKNRKATYMFNLSSLIDYSSYLIIKIKTYRSNKIMSKGYEIMSDDKIMITECKDCAICLNGNDKDNKQSIELTCGHKFHMCCMLELCRNNKNYKFDNIKCPMCRSKTSLVTVETKSAKTLDTTSQAVLLSFNNYKSAIPNNESMVNTRNTVRNTRSIGRNTRSLSNIDFNGGYM